MMMSTITLRDAAASTSPVLDLHLVPFSADLSESAGISTAPENDPILLISASRLARQLGRRFVRRGHPVTMIGRYISDRWHTPTDCYTTLIIGEARKPQVLERASIETAWAVLALSEEDNVNIPVALAATKTYGVPVVVALVDPVRATEYTRLGIDIVTPDVFAESVIWDRIAAWFPAEQHSVDDPR